MTELKIRIGERGELDRDIDRFLDNPRLVEKEPEEVLFLTPVQFSSIFTKSRVETLKTIGDSNPRTMGELVAKLGRPKESVSRDVKFLSSAGLLQIDSHGVYKRPKLLSRNLSVSF